MDHALLYRAAGLVAFWLLGALPTPAIERLTFHQDGKTRQLEGRVVVEAQDGGLLLMARDGVLWRVQPDELIQRTRDDAPFRPYSSQELGARLLAELPPGFAAHRTAHYLILYNTSREYAVWSSSLFERLYGAFINFWTRKGFALSEPEFPLVAIVFADMPGYQQYARKEIGEPAEGMIGYYSLQTNRMAMVDLTGAGRPQGRVRGGAARQTARILAQPEAERTVATIVHEATHQIAFNCGLHARLSDCPMWFSEGIAIYFETPDLRRARGWGTVGAVNQARLARFCEYLTRRPADSLASLVRDDQRFRDPKQGLDAYAEAWALTYYLLRQRPQQYLAYLRLLSAKRPMVWDEPQTRLEEFKQAFGEDLEKLDRDFTQYVLRLR
ncbi:MAG: DUF1570 domain-containing protein [Thermoguttaceae bacterium]